LGFLLLFTYMMVCDFHPNDVASYTAVEIIVAIWVITLFIEELRQVCNTHSSSHAGKYIVKLSCMSTDRNLLTTHVRSSADNFYNKTGNQID